MKLKESRASTFSEPSHYVYRENSWNGRRRGRPFASIKVNTDAIKNKKVPFFACMDFLSVAHAARFTR